MKENLINRFKPLYDGYEKFVAEDIQEYFMEQYSKYGWHAYPGGLPFMKNKEDVDRWFKKTDKEVQELVIKYRNGELDRYKVN